MDFHKKALKAKWYSQRKTFIFQEKLNYVYTATEAHMFQPQVKVNDM